MAQGEGPSETGVFCLRPLLRTPTLSGKSLNIFMCYFFGVFFFFFSICKRFYQSCFSGLNEVTNTQSAFRFAFHSTNRRSQCTSQPREERGGLAQPFPITLAALTVFGLWHLQTIWDFFLGGGICSSTSQGYSALRTWELRPALSLNTVEDCPRGRASGRGFSSAGRPPGVAETQCL